ncbi:hypothetical protein Tco_1563480, partial [Tanacetum coccineum]
IIKWLPTTLQNLDTKKVCFILSIGDCIFDNIGDCIFDTQHWCFIFVTTYGDTMAKGLVVTPFVVHCAGCFYYYIAARYLNPDKTWVGYGNEEFE